MHAYLWQLGFIYIAKFKLRQYQWRAISPIVINACQSYPLYGNFPGCSFVSNCDKISAYPQSRSNVRFIAPPMGPFSQRYGKYQERMEACRVAKDPGIGTDGQALI